MKISSPAFAHLGMIPPRFTCDGENISPSLVIRDVPQGTQSLVLIVDDPDAAMGSWVHWLVWNIDPSINTIDEASLPEGAVQGLNGFGDPKYGGPCPPSGTHRYFFKLYALDIKLPYESSVIRDVIIKAMQNHVLDRAEMACRYHR